MTTTSEDLLGTRETLVQRLKDWNDQTSWKTFFDTYGRLIHSFAQHAGLNDAEAKDVLQETIITVAKKMPTFEYDPKLGSFKSWLLQLTRRRIQDQFRKKQYQRAGKRVRKEQAVSTSVLDGHADPAGFDLEQRWDEEWQRTLTETALQNVKTKVSARSYQLFYLHVCKKMSGRAVAERLGVKLAEVYYAKYTVSRLLQREIKRLEKRGI